MKRFLLVFAFFLAHDCVAKQSILHALYLADRTPVEEELSMIGEFGFLVTGGNTNTSSLTAKINTSQELRHWSYQLIGESLYKQSEIETDGIKQSEASAQRVFFSGQLDYKLDQPNNRLFIYGEYENNRFSDFRHQTALAAGWSSRLWHDPKSEFRYSIGPGYAISVIDKDSTEEDQKGMIVRAALEYKRNFSDQATFRQFISAEADQDFTKTKSETSLSTKLTGALAMKLSFVLNHDTSVTAESEELDTEAAVTVVYQFF